MAKREIQNGRVLLTGASSGIGRALAVELAHGGAQLVLVARREDKLAELAAELSSAGTRVVTLAGDITDADVRQRAVELARSELGGLDVLINNAGISAHGRFVEAGQERLRRIMEVNFFAAAELIRAAAELLVSGNAPLVVNLGSILAHRGVPHNSEYCASKFALCGLSEALRPELARAGIDLLLVSPGTTDTEFFDHLIDQRGELPWGRQQGVSAEHVARATVRAMRRGKHEIIPSGRGRLLVWLNRLSPRLVDWMMRKYG